MATKEPKRPSDILSFYGGRVQIEKKPWGDHFRFIKVGTKGGMLSATGCTKYLDKSRALIPWAVALVGSHITGTFEMSTAKAFSKDEIFLVVREAMGKPDEAKVKGGDAGTLIHDFAYAFALAKINKTPVPTLDHLNKEIDVHTKALNGINAFLDFYLSNEVEFISMEQPTYYHSHYAGESGEHNAFEYIGIIDLVARVNGNIEVIDYKTGKAVYSEQRYQVASYFQAWNSNAAENMQATGVRILNFNKENGDLVEKYIPPAEVERDFHAFKGLHMVAVREKELEAERKL